MERYPEVMEYIRTLVHKVCPNAEVAAQHDYRISIRSGGVVVPVQFGRADIEDFDVALEKYGGTRYFDTIENRIRFRLYLELSAAGRLGDFKISAAFANEVGEWPTNVHRNVEFDSQFASILHSGLKLLDGFITNILSQTEIEVPALSNDAENIRYLIAYFEENGHLSTAGAELESMSYLKGAAICSIAAIEVQRGSSNIPRVKSALNAKINSIVSKLRHGPFEDIPPPECIREFLMQGQGRPAVVVAAQHQRRKPRKPTTISAICWRTSTCGCLGVAKALGLHLVRTIRID